MDTSRWVRVLIGMAEGMSKRRVLKEWRLASRLEEECVRVKEGSWMSAKA